MPEPSRRHVGTMIFVLTALALAIAGAGWISGREVPEWLALFCAAGLGSLSTAWRPGNET